MPRLSDLKPGTCFQYPECRKIATLLSLGPSGARIKYEGGERVVEIEGDEDRGIAPASFVRPAQVVLVSDESEVIVLPCKSQSGSYVEKSPRKTSARASSGGSSTQPKHRRRKSTRRRK